MDLLAADYADDAPASGAGGDASNDGVVLPPRKLLARAGVGGTIQAAPPISATTAASALGVGGVGMSAPQWALQQVSMGGPMTVNVPASALLAPVVGPANPHEARRFASGSGHTSAGVVQATALDEASFAAQYNSYAAQGYAADPSGSGAFVGDHARYAQYHGVAPSSVSVVASLPPSRRAMLANAAGGAGAGASSRSGAGSGPVPGMKRARLENDDVSSEGYLGPWAGYEGEDASRARSNPLAEGTLTLQQRWIRVQEGRDPDGPGKLEGEELTAAFARVKAEVEKEKERVAREKAGAGAGKAGAGAPPGAGPKGAGGGGSGSSASEAASSSSGAGSGSGSGAGAGSGSTAIRSTFHGKEEVDYQGRAWIEPPKGKRPDGGDHECFVPKKLLCKWTGHSKGVSSAVFYPGTGHLFLSSSLDGKCKIWDVNGESGGGGAPRGVRRTYLGHSAGVRDARFDLEGRRFSSCSFDKRVLVWDAESGSCLADLTDGSTPFSSAWAPNDPNILLVAGANRKILQYDLRTKGIALEYDHHLGPVNTILVIDGGRKFISTSDDKRILVWETGTPVPVRYVMDPSMHAVPAVAMHPSNTCFVAQSMDNTLLGYTCGEKVSRLTKKTFTGHVNAGFACVPSFSPDGRFLVSGDGEGTAWFWDWNNGRVLNKLKAHDDGPAIGTDWHPLEPSWVLTCGWDGVVKMWG
jgi:pre-mRNA-processing factor 17